MWDFPRPPAVETVDERLRVELAGVVIADTTRGLRVCETSQAPAYYFPPDDVRGENLVAVAGATLCEWKGVARYLDVVAAGRSAPRGAWTYPDPTLPYRAIAGHVAFYPRAVDACWVGDELVAPMDGDFYGGWITADLVGPFKGAPGTRHW